jgi:sensor histidine kinase regulating citrate/malate metabolism
LLENAIIATDSCEYKQIKISFGKDDGFFAITVQDSGIPFESETLKNLGKKPTSTHLHEGGSGIGYMTIFNIMNTYKASLIIREFAPNHNGFTKSVSFRFDGENAYTVHSDCQNTA